jgi:RNAse (barnase) inhibitor barstar
MVSSYLYVHRGVVGVQDLETPAKTYYRQCLQQDMTPADFKGVALDDFWDCMTSGL